MNFNSYTQKSLEVVQNARNLAVQCGHQQLAQVHLLLAMLQQDGGLIPQLLKRMEISVESLEAAATQILRKIPSVVTSRDADRFYISADTDAALTAAQQQITLVLTQAAKTAIVAASYDPQYGARPLRRYVQHTVETMLSRKILRGEILPGQTVTVDAVDGELVMR